MSRGGCRAVLADIYTTPHRLFENSKDKIFIMEPYHCDRMDDALNLLNTTFYELSITYFKIRS